MSEARRELATVEGRIPAQLSELLGPRALRQLGLILGLAAAVAAGIGLFMWAKEPVYRPVFNKLSEQDSAAVMDALQAAGIDYRLDGGTGTVMVPATQIHNARLKLAAQGLPQGGSLGYELLQKEQGFGTSQFMESARFNRALETEIARTIQTVQGVESVRVHLAIPKQSVFIRERGKPSASVLVSLFPGRALSDGQVASIVHLVSSSVPDLTEDQVTVVDQRGRLLSGGDDTALGATQQQLDYKQQIEAAYVRRIEDLLSPMIGADRVRAQVNARLDFSQEESTQEVFDPTGVIRSEQSSEQRSLDSDLARGIPGALTNQPPGAGTVDPAGAEAPAETALAGNLNVATTRNYEIGKTIRHTRRPTGTVERLSVAVLVDQKQVTDAEGKVTSEPLTQEELDRIGSLVRQAVGFDEARGDSIDVISAPFKAESIEPVETPIHQQPWFWEAIKAVGAFVLGALLLFKVVLPLVRAFSGAPVKPAEREEVTATSEVPQLPPGEAPRQLSGPEAAAYAENRALLANNSYEDSLTMARQVVSQEPAVAANVVKNWLSTDE